MNTHALYSATTSEVATGVTWQLVASVTFLKWEENHPEKNVPLCTLDAGVCKLKFRSIAKQRNDGAVQMCSAMRTALLLLHALMSLQQ